MKLKLDAHDLDVDGFKLLMTKRNRAVELEVRQNPDDEDGRDMLCLRTSLSYDICSHPDLIDYSDELWFGEMASALTEACKRLEII